MDCHVLWSFFLEQWAERKKQHTSAFVGDWDCPLLCLLAFGADNFHHSRRCSPMLGRIDSPARFHREEGRMRTEMTDREEETVCRRGRIAEKRGKAKLWTLFYSRIHYHRHGSVLGTAITRFFAVSYFFRRISRCQKYVQYLGKVLAVRGLWAFWSSTVCGM